MPIIAGDLLWLLSIKTGSAGYSLAQSDPDAGLGKYCSTTQVIGSVSNEVFDDVSGDENAASDVEYRCLFLLNNHATLTWTSGVVWIYSETAGGAAWAIGVDPTAASAKGSAGAQAVEVADEDTAPAGVSFSAPATKGAGLAMGDIGPGQVKAVWIRRTAANTAAVNDDGMVLKIEGDTAA